MRTQSIIAADIHVGNRWRTNLDEKTIDGLVASIGSLGLRNPIAVIFRDDVEIEGEACGGVPVLVAGRHRLEAIRRLGWKTVDCEVFTDEIDAEKWEISENIHRADLTVQQRAEQVERWVELEIKQQEMVGQSLQSATNESKRADGRGHRPEEGVRMAARALGLESTEAHRLVSIGGLSEEAKAAAREVGLDDNQAAQLAAARAGKAVVKKAKAEGKEADDPEVQRAKAEAERARIEKEAQDRRDRAAERERQKKEVAEAPTIAADKALEVIATDIIAAYDHPATFNDFQRLWGRMERADQLAALEWAHKNVKSAAEDDFDPAKLWLARG